MSKLEQLKNTHWKDLTPYDWQLLEKRGITNGCGGGGNGLKERVIRWIVQFFLNRIKASFIQADCGIHDFTYWQGGDEERRAECDQGFYFQICEDIDDQTEGQPFRNFGLTFLAGLFYVAVRVFGRFYFNYL